MINVIIHPSANIDELGPVRDDKSTGELFNIQREINPSGILTPPPQNLMDWEEYCF